MKNNLNPKYISQIFVRNFQEKTFNFYSKLRSDILLCPHYLPQRYTCLFLVETFQLVCNPDRTMDLFSTLLSHSPTRFTSQHRFCSRFSFLYLQEQGKRVALEYYARQSHQNWLNFTFCCSVFVFVFLFVIYFWDFFFLYIRIEYLKDH